MAVVRLGAQVQRDDHQRRDAARFLLQGGVWLYFAMTLSGEPKTSETGLRLSAPQLQAKTAE